MKTLLVSLALLALVSCQTAPKIDDARRLSVLQGATDDQSAQFNVLIKRGDEYRIGVSGPSQLTITDTLKTGRTDSDWQVFTFTVRGLKPGETYVLTFSNGTGQPLDERFFKALPADIKKPKIAVISCTSDRYKTVQGEQWRQVWSKEPDALFLIGDNVYVDSGPAGRLEKPTDADIWRRYVETRHTLDLYQMKNLIPTFATWDDHDFGKNDGDMSFPYKKQSAEIFDIFFPQKNNTWLVRGPGVSSRLQWAGQSYVFFDDRSFRTARKARGDSHFGTEQEKWFYDFLKNDKGPFWLISGDQFFGGYHEFESYEGNHPRSFQNFLQRLKQENKRVVFISGDRHLAEVMRIPKNTLGYVTYELTSSGLHATMFPGSLEKSGVNKRSVFGKDGELHFMMLEGEVKDAGVKFKPTFYAPRSRVLFDDTFEVQ